jgi:hypothetical protein
MIEDDFYATLKLMTGEEIFAKVAATDKDNETFLLVSNPVIISEVKNNQTFGYRFEPWIKTSNEDLFILRLQDVLLITESNNKNIIKMYNIFIFEMNNEVIESKKNKSDNGNGLSKKMGYIANINDAKILLEKIYKNS